LRRALRSGAAAPRLRLTQLALGALDRLDAEALVLGVCSDDRPLTGAAGAADWRLQGRLSGFLQSGDFGGRADEVLLTDTCARIGTGRVLLVGLGPRGALDLAAARRGLRSMLVVAKKARLSRLALELPGLDQPGGPGPAELGALTLEVLDKAHADAQLELLVPSREVGEALRAALGDAAAWREDEPPPAEE